MERKIILVTGASSGFGKTIAAQLVKEGHFVYGTSRKATVSDAVAPCCKWTLSTVIQWQKL